MKLSEKALGILQNELPYPWEIGKDIKVTETETDVIVEPISDHATEHIGGGERLEFSKNVAPWASA